MSVIVTADLHWNDNTRDAARHDFVDWMVGCLKQHRADALFVLGDLTEGKDEHRSWLVNAVVDHLARWSRQCPVIVIRGNHDYLDPEHPFFGFVNHIEGLYWINRPMDDGEGSLSVHHGDRLRHSIGRYLMLPHTRDFEKDWDGYKLRDYGWVFTHNTFEGSDYGQGPLAKGIPLDVVKGARVISGDVHIPQKIGPVTYVGAPYLIDFGDDYEPRVAMVDGSKLSFVKVDGPQKRLIEVRSLKELVEKGRTLVEKGDIVKVRVDLTMAEHAKWPEMQAKVREWADKQGVVLHAATPVLLREEGGKPVR